MSYLSGSPASDGWLRMHPIFGLDLFNLFVLDQCKALEIGIDLGQLGQDS